MSVPVIHIGIPGCIGDSSCEGRGCWTNVQMLNTTYSIVDANSSAIVGPAFTVTTGCGCNPSVNLNSNQIEKQLVNQTLISIHSHLLKETSLNTTSGNKPKTDTLLTTFSHLNEMPNKLNVPMKNRGDCLHDHCLNGGKCVPTSSGKFKLVYLNHFTIEFVILFISYAVFYFIFISSII